MIKLVCHDDRPDSPTRGVIQEIHLGEHATNCIFDGSTLWVTATKVADIEASQRTGTFWRVRTRPTGRS